MDFRKVSGFVILLPFSLMLMESALLVLAFLSIVKPLSVSTMISPSFSPSLIIQSRLERLVRQYLMASKTDVLPAPFCPVISMLLPLICCSEIPNRDFIVILEVFIFTIPFTYTLDILEIFL